MNTWKIENGDVAVDVRGKVDLIDRAPKVVQDLKSWLFNDLGYNKFHPDMGSKLDSYVGQVVTPKLISDIKETVREVLDGYMDMQMEDIRKRIEERGEPYSAIGLAQPSSLVKNWTSLVVHEYAGDIIIKIAFRTFTNDFEEVRLALAGGQRS